MTTVVKQCNTETAKWHL